MINVLEDASDVAITPAGSILSSWSKVPDIIGMMGKDQKKALAIWKGKGNPLPNKPREK